MICLIVTLGGSILPLRSSRDGSVALCAIARGPEVPKGDALLLRTAGVAETVTGLDCGVSIEGENFQPVADFDQAANVSNG
jgi:hypothetical protein